MKSIIKIAFPAVMMLSSITLPGYTPAPDFHTRPHHSIIQTPDMSPKIQVAILLDVSNSMDGLIDQAKAQLWNMVSVMGRATCGKSTPQIEIALYEYGRTSNDVKKGFVKQIDGFTTDLDGLSKHLFALRTEGGDEYCGQVIYTALSDLNWDPAPSAYKVIFIAGNEDFLQGKMLYTRACDEAKKRGVIVNTIYCGDKAQGIREHWNIAGECGNGSYTNINQDEKREDIPTPYDSTLFVLNEELNGTYVYYGAAGAKKFEDQASMDKANFAYSPGVAMERVSVKGKSTLYKNSSWDLIDAQVSDSTVIEKVDLKTLPKDLQNKSRKELKQIVSQKNAKRLSLQKKIGEISTKRSAYIATQKARSSKTTGATLETEVERIIKVQAKRYNMAIE